MQLYTAIPGIKVFLLTAAIVAFYAGTCGAQNNADSSILDEGLAGKVFGTAVEHKHRTIHNKLNAEVIDSTPDENLVAIVTDNVRLKVDKNLSNEYEVVMKQPEAVRSVYVVHQVEVEVNNGGFSRLFSGQAHKFCQEAESAFKNIDAPLFTELIRKANQVYKEEGLCTKLKALDEEFYSLYDKEDIKKLKIDHIRKNKRALQP